MLTYQECLDMCDLDPAEVDAIAEHEHLDPMLALALGQYLITHQGEQKIKKIILELGVFDQFHLAFEPRRIRDLLKKNKFRLEYQEFRGNHFDTASREEGVWARLEKSWKTH